MAPPPTKIASGSGRSASASGSAAVHHLEVRDAEVARVEPDLRRPGPRRPRPRSPGSAGARASTRCRSSRHRRRRPRAAGRAGAPAAPGPRPAGRAWSAGRRCRRRRRAGRPSRTRRTGPSSSSAITFSRGDLGRPGRGRALDARLLGRPEVAEHHQVRVAVAVATSAARRRRPASSRRRTAPARGARARAGAAAGAGRGATSETTWVDSADQPIRARARATDETAGSTSTALGPEQVDQRAADARDHRVPAGDHDHAASGVRRHQLAQAGAQRRRQVLARLARDLGHQRLDPGAGDQHLGGSAIRSRAPSGSPVQPSAPMPTTRQGRGEGLTHGLGHDG